MSDTTRHLDLLNSFAAADILDCPHNYVVRLAKLKMIPHYELPDGELRFDRGELLEWVRGMQVDAEGQADA